ncbi:hypothetical protein [Brevibacterium paucivorans]
MTSIRLQCHKHRKPVNVATFDRVGGDWVARVVFGVQERRGLAREILETQEVLALLEKLEQEAGPNFHMAGSRGSVSERAQFYRKSLSAMRQQADELGMNVEEVAKVAGRVRKGITSDRGFRGASNVFELSPTGELRIWCPTCLQVHGWGYRSFTEKRALVCQAFDLLSSRGVEVVPLGLLARVCKELKKRA